MYQISDRFISSSPRLGRLIFALSFSLLLFAIYPATGHPMPNSVLLLDIKSDKVHAELQLPLNELELAIGHDVNRNPDHLVERLGPLLRAYILSHVHPVSLDGKAWSVAIADLLVQPVQQSQSGPYKELTVHLLLSPPSGSSTRQFILNYDVIIHQVVTHFALVSVRQDWDNGQTENYPYQVGVIRLDVVSNTIPPLQVNITEGSLWTGFTSMFYLGMQHIKEGTDHLLFLLTLLLPSTLLVANHKWGNFGGLNYSLIRILKIVTAFTLGHSITLLLGAMHIFHVPGRSIEVLIAISILISAIHALKPLFPGKEIYVAAGFGLIHGMAFAATLVNLNLDAGRMILSILGFNLGIEIMQVFIIAITIPWLIVLSQNHRYTGLRVGGAIFAIVASLAWIAERITGQANPITIILQQASAGAKWMVLILAIAAFTSYVLTDKKLNYIP